MLDLQVPRRSPCRVLALIKLISIEIPRIERDPIHFHPRGCDSTSGRSSVHYLDLIQVRHAPDNNVGDASGICGCPVKRLHAYRNATVPAVRRLLLVAPRNFNDLSDRNWNATNVPTVSPMPRDPSSYFQSTWLLRIGHERNSRMLLAPECSTCSRLVAQRNF